MDYSDSGYSNLLQYGASTDDAALGDVGGEAAMLGTTSSSALTNPTTEAVDPENIQGGEILSQLTLAKDAHVKGGATGYNEGDGFWLGSFNRSSTDYRFFIGNSAGDNMTYANGVLSVTGTINVSDGGTIGGFEVGADYIRDVGDSFGLASTVSGSDDVRFWAGSSFADRATAPFRVTESGILSAGNSTDFITYNGSIIRVSGRISAQQEYTAGHLIPAGSATAIESDGMMYRTRMTAFSTVGADQDENIGDHHNAISAGELIEISSTVKLYVIATVGGGGNNISITRIACSPSSSTITKTTTSISGVAPSVVRISDTKALLVYSSGGGFTDARLISGLDTTLTVGALFSLGNAPTTAAVFVERVSDTEAVYSRTSSGNDVEFKGITITGTTLAFAAGPTLTIAPGGTFRAGRIKRFGSSSDYAVYYRDMANSISYMVAVSYTSGGTATKGTAVNVNGDSGSTFTYEGRFHPYSDATLAFVRVASTLEVFASFVTVSGTTIVVSTETTLTSVASTDHGLSVGYIGPYTFCLGYRSAASASWLQMYEIDSSSFTAVGSALDLSGSAAAPITPSGLKLSPTRLLTVKDDLGIGEVQVTFNVVDMTTNYTGLIGVTPAEVSDGAAGLVVLAGDLSSGLTGLTTATLYYAGIDGELITSALGGSSKIGVATGSSSMVIQV